MLAALRTRILPWVIWLATMGAVAWLWPGRYAGQARGFVEDLAVHVAAPADARVESIAVVAGQHVSAGDVLAILDARELTAELEILAAQRTQIEAQLGAVASETQVRLGETSHKIETSVEEAERALQAARTARAVRSAEVEAMTAQLGTLQDLVGKQMADRRELDALVVKHAAVKKELQTYDATINLLVAQVAAARARRGGLPGDADDRATAPLRAELAVIRQQAQLLALRRDALTLRAPVAGHISALHLRPGAFALAGTTVLTLTPDDPGDDGPRVFVCLAEPQAIPVRPGEAVTLQTATGPALSAYVERLGPDVVQLPERCWPDPRVPTWGRPAYVALDEPAPLVSGQGFTVAFLGEPSPRARAFAPRPPVQAALDQAPAPASASATPAAPLTPALLRVPPALQARTRFEPSGLTWSPRLDRFVLVSDDTGLAGETEHVPWLFTMDVRGAIDPEPLVIAGLEGVSDLEAIAPAPDGGLYLLASQSKSRKGKRPAARQRFVHVALTDAGPRAVAVALLATLLDDAGAAALARLGIASTGALDLEGMTATREGGLLLGLKAPLSPRNEALIWHLERPDDLLAAGRLDAGKIALWGAIPLTVEADGAAVPAGIAELLELEDGSLLVAATASGADPRRQDGVLVHVRGRDGLGDPRPVRVFPGLKPEGLARTDGAVVLTFDTGADPPQWMELPWPEP